MLAWIRDTSGTPAYSTASTIVLEDSRVQEMTRSTENRPKEHSHLEIVSSSTVNKGLQDMKLCTWKEVATAALNRQEWRRSVVQRIHMDVV